MEHSRIQEILLPPEFKKDIFFQEEIINDKMTHLYVVVMFIAFLMLSFVVIF
jgi:hypothetical protein